MFSNCVYSIDVCAQCIHILYTYIINNIHINSCLLYVCVYALYVACMYSMNVYMHVDGCVGIVWHMNA